MRCLELFYLQSPLVSNGNPQCVLPFSSTSHVLTEKGSGYRATFMKAVSICFFPRHPATFPVTPVRITDFTLVIRFVTSVLIKKIIGARAVMSMYSSALIGVNSVRRRLYLMWIFSIALSKTLTIRNFFGKKKSLK